MLVAGLVAAAFLTVRSGQTPVLEGRPGGDPPAVATDDRTTDTPNGEPGAFGGARPDGTTVTVAPLAETAAPGASGLDTPTTDTPTTILSTSGTPSAEAGMTGPPGGETPKAPVGTTPSADSRTEATGHGPARRSHTPTAPAPGRAVSFERLRVGDCFDIDRAAPGTAVRHDCDTPHQAELVARPRLTGRYPTDDEIREAATRLCREPLRLKAARQPLGTRWTTFVQYPYRTSYLLGSQHVACSLAATAATGGKLNHRLR
ncbi:MULTISPECIES: hypothetical protein [unclassified Streptomyces]|uniref:hypothetical protein n=1 Tax=unclassified Streptomyces TaxID=2593676 RepID=UPI0016606E83|nr:MULTISPECIES: hypothetical protein [unclassified Streptomyces]